MGILAVVIVEYEWSRVKDRYLVRGQSLSCKFVGVLGCNSLRPRCFIGFEYYFDKLSYFESRVKAFFGILAVVILGIIGPE